MIYLCLDRVIVVEQTGRGLAYPTVRAAVPRGMMGHHHGVGVASQHHGLRVHGGVQLGGV